MDAHQLYLEYLLGKKLLADHIRNGAARGLYAHKLADHVITLVADQEEELHKAAQKAIMEEAS